jgi:hypothetical protein
MGFSRSLAPRKATTDLGTIAETAGLTDESVCPTLVRKGLPSKTICDQDPI